MDDRSKEQSYAEISRSMNQPLRDREATNLSRIVRNVAHCRLERTELESTRSICRWIGSKLALYELAFTVAIAGWLPMRRNANSHTASRLAVRMHTDTDAPYKLAPRYPLLLTSPLLSSPLRSSSLLSLLHGVLRFLQLPRTRRSSLLLQSARSPSSPCRLCHSSICLSASFTSDLLSSSSTSFVPFSVPLLPFSLFSPLLFFRCRLRLPVSRASISPCWFAANHVVSPFDLDLPSRGPRVAFVQATAVPTNSAFQRYNVTVIWSSQSINDETSHFRVDIVGCPER